MTASLSDILANSHDVARPVVVINSQGTESVDWLSLRDDALRIAAALQSLGLGPTNRVALLGETSRELIATIQAVWLIGAAVTVLPLPTRTRDTRIFSRQTLAKLRRLQPSLIAADAKWQSLGLEVTRRGQPLVTDLARLHAKSRSRSPGHWDAPPHDPDAAAIVQFTSGSTSDPKAVLVPERCLKTNIDLIADGWGLREDDRIVSWLPLFHDMGLIGMLAVAMLTGTSLVLADPATFATQPRNWMEWISAYQGSITCAPNSAYAMAARSLAMGGSYNLGSCRLAVNGAEPIDVPSFERFIAAAGAHGFDPAAAFCVYGLAEATLAVSFPKAGAGLHIDAVDRSLLESTGKARPSSRDSAASRLLALLGRPLPGFGLRVRSTSGTLAEEREVGEIEISGESLTPGYLDGPELAASDGWLRTGDIGYLTDGQLVICGRSKDMIIIAGRNLYPEDLERAVAEIEGVRAGNVIAFSVETGGHEAVVVVAESRKTDEALRHEIWSVVRDAADTAPDDVVLLEPGALPKTSSGKLQRAACREAYLSGTL